MTANGAARSRANARTANGSPDAHNGGRTAAQGAARAVPDRRGWYDWTGRVRARTRRRANARAALVVLCGAVGRVRAGNALVDHVRAERKHAQAKPGDRVAEPAWSAARIGGVLRSPREHSRILPSATGRARLRTRRHNSFLIHGSRNCGPSCAIVARSATFPSALAPQQSPTRSGRERRRSPRDRVDADRSGHAACHR